MTLEIVPATIALVAATEEWLDAEEAAYQAGCCAAEDSDWDITPPPRGFRCNWDTIKRNWQEFDKALHILIRDEFSVGFLFERDYLEVRPDERGRGYGRLLADFMVKRAFDEGRSLIEIGIAPCSAIPFWQEMGFTLVDGRPGNGGGHYAYRRFHREFPLGAGPQVLCSIEFMTEKERYGGAIPFHNFQGLGERLPNNTIQLPERVVCLPPYEASGDPFARIRVDGKEIFYDKLKRPEAARCGIQLDAGSTYFIEQLRIP